MKKDEMRRWLAGRIETQSRLTIGAIVGMIVIGLIATLMEFGLFVLIIYVGFVGNWTLASLVTLGIQGAIQGLIWFRLPSKLPDTEYELNPDGDSDVIRVARNMTAVWTYAFGSMETDQSWQDRLIGILTMPQRMCAAAWFSWNRLQQLKSIEIEPCAAVIRLLFKEGEGIEIEKINDELNLADLPTTMHHVSLIDGVIVLSRRTPGLSLAPRLVDDIVGWKKKQHEERPL